MKKLHTQGRERRGSLRGSCFVLPLHCSPNITPTFKSWHRILPCLAKSSWAISGHSVRQSTAVSEPLGGWGEVVVRKYCAGGSHWAIAWLSCVRMAALPQGWWTGGSQKGNQHFIKVNDQGYTSYESWPLQDSSAKHWAISSSIAPSCFGPISLSLFVITTVSF